MQYPWGIVHDIDGCMIVDSSGKPAVGSTIVCEHNDTINVGEMVHGIIDDRLMPESVIREFEAERGRIQAPVDIALCSEYAHYDLGIISMKEFFKIHLGLSLGIREDAVRECVKSIGLTPGVEEYVDWARREGAKQLVVTGGWDILAEHLTERLGLDYGAGTETFFEDGRLSRVERADKSGIISGKLKECGILYERTVAIDDSDPEISMYGLPIAFCPRNPDVFKGYDVVVVTEPNYNAVQRETENWLRKVGI